MHVPDALTSAALLHSQLSSQLASACASTTVEVLRSFPVGSSDREYVPVASIEAANSTTMRTGPAPLVSFPSRGQAGPVGRWIAHAVSSMDLASAAASSNTGTTESQHLRSLLATVPTFLLLRSLDVGLSQCVLVSAAAAVALERAAADDTGPASRVLPTSAVLTTSLPVIDLRDRFPPWSVLLSQSRTLVEMPRRPDIEKSSPTPTQTRVAGLSQPPMAPHAAVRHQPPKPPAGAGIASPPRIASRRLMASQAGLPFPGPLPSADASEPVMAASPPVQIGVPVDLAGSWQQPPQQHQFQLNAAAWEPPSLAESLPRPETSCPPAALSALPPRVPNTRGSPECTPQTPTVSQTASAGGDDVDRSMLMQLPLLGHVTFPDGRSIPVVLGPDGVPRYLLEQQ